MTLMATTQSTCSLLERTLDRWNLCRSKGEKGSCVENNLLLIMTHRFFLPMRDLFLEKGLIKDDRNWAKCSRKGDVDYREQLCPIR
jgi:hypothetical protein